MDPSYNCRIHAKTGNYNYAYGYSVQVLYRTELKTFSDHKLFRPISQIIDSLLNSLNQWFSTEGHETLTREPWDIWRKKTLQIVVEIFFWSSMKFLEKSLLTVVTFFFSFFFSVFNKNLRKNPFELWWRPFFFVEGGHRPSKVEWKPLV